MRSGSDNQSPGSSPPGKFNPSLLALNSNAHDQEVASNPAYTLERAGQSIPLPSGGLQLQRWV